MAGRKLCCLATGQLNTTVAFNQRLHRRAGPTVRLASMHLSNKQIFECLVLGSPSPRHLGYCNDKNGFYTLETPSLLGEAEQISKHLHRVEGASNPVFECGEGSLEEMTCLS